MAFTVQTEAPPLREDATGALRMKTLRLVATAIGLALLIPFCVCVCAQDSVHKIQTASLAGLPRFYVIVNSTPAAERDGLTADLIRTAVEIRLRTTGIKVITKTDYTAEDGMLWITIDALKIEGMPLYAFSFSIDIKQFVAPPRDADLKVLGATWQAGGVAVIGQAKLREGARQDTLQFVDKFINDYLAANPK